MNEDKPIYNAKSSLRVLLLDSENIYIACGCALDEESYLFFLANLFIRINLVQKKKKTWNKVLTMDEPYNKIKTIYHEKISKYIVLQSVEFEYMHISINFVDEKDIRLVQCLYL